MSVRGLRYSYRMTAQETFIETLLSWETDLAAPPDRTEYREDDELAVGIRDGDPDALEEFYDKTSRKAFGLAYRVLGDSSGAEDVVQGRPAPDLILRSMKLCGVADPMRVAVVGDTKNDLLAAHNAGTGWSIAVLSGAHGFEILSRHPHSAILESVAELPAWIQNSAT